MGPSCPIKIGQLDQAGLFLTHFFFFIWGIGFCFKICKEVKKLFQTDHVNYVSTKKTVKKHLL